MVKKDNKESRLLKPREVVDDSFSIGFGTVFSIIFVLFAIIILLMSYTIVPAGSRGIIFSATEGVRDFTFTEGFHFKKPVIEDVIKIDVRTKKIEKKIASTSNDQQKVAVDIAINYRPNAEKVHKLYQEIGLDYVERIITPAMEESIKYAMAQYKAEDLLTNRQEVSLLALEKLREKIDGKYIIIDSVILVNIEFSTRFAQAIENKVVAEQEVAKEKNVLEREKIKQETIIIQAEAQKTKAILEAEGKSESMLLERRAEAEGIELIKEASKDSDEVVQLRMVDRWNGQLPRIVSGGGSGLLMGIDALSNITG